MIDTHPQLIDVVADISKLAAGTYLVQIAKGESIKDLSKTGHFIFGPNLVLIAVYPDGGIKQEIL